MIESSLGIIIAEILSVEKVERSKNLFVIELAADKEKYLVATSLASYYQKSDLIGKQVPIKIDVDPKIIFGVKSNARLVAILNNNEPVLLIPESRVNNGAIVL